MISGVNHITIAVNDLAESFHFYTHYLSMKPQAKWRTGAYLTLGDLWFCLSVDNAKPSEDYSHIALTVASEHFPLVKKRLESVNVVQWKQNTSEGHSFYFLDPKGHKLELHVGSLASRLASLKQAPYEGLELFE
ncbi:fosfomycin resistance glutathione transferase [Thalassotalea euphylliae]|uniref:fosfomycin resistance glutathione transferase n=1 Tax=Thalassotalea euphylliae TaxID=1655234 RepID=UPI0036294B80